MTYALIAAFATEYVTGAPSDSIPAIEEIQTIELGALEVFSRTLSITLVVLLKLFWKIFSHSFKFSKTNRTAASVATISVNSNPYDLAYVPTVNKMYVTTKGGTPKIEIIDLV